MYRNIKIMLYNVQTIYEHIPPNYLAGPRLNDMTVLTVSLRVNEATL